MGYFQDKLEKLEAAKAREGDNVDVSAVLADNSTNASPYVSSTTSTAAMEKYFTGEGNHYQMVSPDVTEKERTFGRPNDVWTPLSGRTKLTMPVDELVDKVWYNEGVKNQKENLSIIAQLSGSRVKKDWDEGYMASNPFGAEWGDEVVLPSGYTSSKNRAIYALNNKNDYKTMKAIGKNPTSFFGVLNDISSMKGSHLNDDEVKQVNDMIEAAQKSADVYWGVYYDKDRQAFTPELDLISDDIGSPYSDIEKPVYKYEFDSNISPVDAGGGGYNGEITGTWNIKRIPTNIDDYSRRRKLTTNESYTSKKAYDERVYQIRKAQYDVAKKTGNLDVFLSGINDIDKLPFVSVNDKKLFYQDRINKGSMTIEEAVEKSGGKISDFKLSPKQKHNYYRSQVVGGFLTPEEAARESGFPVSDFREKKKKKKKRFGLF